MANRNPQIPGLEVQYPQPAQPKIPGLEVTEHFNPNVGPNGASAEARAYQGARYAPPNMGPQPKPGLSPAPGVPPTMRSVMPAAALGALAGVGQRLYDNSTAKSAPQPQPLQPAAPGEIPKDTRFAAPAAIETHPLGIGPNNEFTRNVGNIVNAIPGGQALAGTVRAGSNLAKALSLAAPAQAFVQGAQTGQAVTQNLPALPQSQPTAAPVAPPTATYSNEGRNAPTMRVEGPPAGSIIRDGNKYSGKDIKFGADIYTPGGKLVNGGDKGFGVSSLDSSEGFRQDQLELARNAAERAATPMGGVTGIGPRGGSMMDDLVAKHNASKGVDMSGLSPYDRAMMTQQQRAADKANDVSMRGQDITAQGQVLNAQTAARGQDNMLTAQREGNQVSMRGQDISAGTALSGQQNSARIAAAQARMEQMNKDRDYAANQDKLTFEQRQQSDKDLTTQLGSMLTTKDDKGNTVTDHAAVAEHKAGIVAFLEGKIREAQSVPPSSPDYAKAQALAARLQKEGPRALGPDRVQQLVAQISAKKANAENASSWNPFKGTQVDSSDPAAYNIVGKEKNWFTPDQYIHANGARTPTQVIDRKGGSPVFNFGAPVSTQYDSIKREGAR